MADFKSFFDQDFQGTEAFISEIVIPVFGDDFVPANEDILQSNPNCKPVADRANILAIKRFGSYDFDVPMQLFEITLSENVRISYSRVNIQALVRQLMETYSAALIVFHYPDNTGEWRVSYVSKGSNNHDATSAKRFTYLMGKDHKCRTAAERFAILAGKEKTEKNITDAFSVEALSIDFFERYKNIYADFVEHITGKRYKKESGKWVEKTMHEPNEQLTNSFNGDEKAVRDYVKKMMGRLVFLQFLQRKGWLGVPVDKNWGEGNSEFLQDLFRNSNRKDDFLDAVLEPLLFKTLNDGERPNEIADARLGENIKIPYLNGGLFERDELDKREVVFPSELFQNLFQFFSEYNFTIDENDPNDAEVGVDPEMLGRIFENLLEDNKDKGAFYTPKEIVQYMCRESLIAYLTTDNDTMADAIKLLVLQHKTEGLSAEQKRMFLSKLKAVKVCDPAIGSGAFPMGMLYEIYHCIVALDGTTEQAADSSSLSAVEVKKHIIQNSIYGVDLEKGAVDIARLRFWLALVVDEDKPQPLPNLDYKIMQGNSLLESFEGIDLSLIATNDIQIVEPQKDLFGNYIENQLSISFTSSEDIKKIQHLTQKYFGTEIHKQKETIKKEIEREIHNQIELKISKHVEGKIFELESLGEISSMTAKQAKRANEIQQELSKIEDIRRKLILLENSDTKPFFLWNLFFKDVFDKGGFDIIIGNPPYVRQERLSAEYKDTLIKIYPEVGNGIADLYVYFFGLGLNKLAENGVLMFITLNKYLKTQYGKELRNTLAEKVDVDLIIDFFELPVFQASTDAAITKIINCKSENPTRYYPIKTLENLDLFEITNGYYQTTIKDETEWKFVEILEIELLNKLQKNTISLKEFTNDKIFSGIKTGYNKAFVLEIQDANTLLNSESKNIVKKYAQSTDIKQWHLEDDNRHFLATGFSLDIKNEYSTAFNYLSQFRERLESRGDQGLTCYNLRPCAYYDEFEKTKIIYIHTAKDHQFYLDTDGCYINNSCYMIGSESRFLFCFLNSKLFKWFKRIKFVAYGDGSEGGRCKLDYNKMVTVPIKKDVDEKPYAEIVDCTLALKKSNPDYDTTDADNKIDLMIYRLYDLTYDEVKVVDPEFGLTEEEYNRIEIEG